MRMGIISLEVVVVWLCCAVPFIIMCLVLVELLPADDITALPGKTPKDENPKKEGIQVRKMTLSPLFDWYRSDYGKA